MRYRQMEETRTPDCWQRHSIFRKSSAPVNTAAGYGSAFLIQSWTSLFLLYTSQGRTFHPSNSAVVFLVNRQQVECGASFQYEASAKHRMTLDGILSVVVSDGFSGTPYLFPATAEIRPVEHTLQAIVPEMRQGCADRSGQPSLLRTALSLPRPELSAEKRNESGSLGKRRAAYFVC